MEAPKTCAWCQFHQWADHLSYHICIKMDDDESQEMHETCHLWRRSSRLGGE